MTQKELESTARALVEDGRGILAADESFNTIKKRFDGVGVTSTEETRRAYRGLLFTTPRVEEYLSGVILYDETIRQKSDDGTPFPELLARKSILPGIKVDTGAKDMAGFPGEKVTEGLDGLRDRFAEYRKLGARFAKWRGVITIGDGIPTDTCIQANAHALARYASLAQEAGITPIVEPEVLINGDHDIDRCDKATTATLKAVFSELIAHRVHLEGLLLKPNMVIPGKECPNQVSYGAVAEATVRCLRRVVPAAVPGIVFLSGGQSPEAATEHLNEMNKLGPHPWALGFSYARALQDPTLKAWKGEASNVDQAQQIFHNRAKCTSAARYGKYSKDMELAA